MPCTVKVARVRKARAKARVSSKVTETKATPKLRAKSGKSRHFDGYCNQCGEYGHKKPDCAGKGEFFDGTCNMCGAHGHKRVDCPAKTVAHIASESVTEPNEEPAGIESLKRFFALEPHDGEEEMASLTDANLVRLLLDSGTEVSACSPAFAPCTDAH